MRVQVMAESAAMQRNAFVCQNEMKVSK